MLRSVLLLAFAAILASQIPYLLGLTHGGSGESAQQIDAPSSPTSGSGAAAAYASSVQLAADGRGHFNGTFKLNGKPVDGLVDTGASSVAINESTARRLGFTANGLDYRYTINTANGSTKGARVKLDRVEIGSIRVRDVDAFVLKDEALSGTLIGMTFLNRLSSFQVQGSTLRLNP